MKRSLAENLTVYGGDVWIVTLTAPGAEDLPCSDDCAHRGEHLQRAEAGCRVDPARAIPWNRSARRRWSKHYSYIATRLKREGHSNPVLCGVWQLQTRGVLHLHLVLAYGNDTDRAAADRFARLLRERAPMRETSPATGHRFGYVDARNRGTRSTVMEGGRAARYLSKYLAGNAERSQLAESVTHHKAHAIPGRHFFVARWLLSLTGCTMTRLRRVRLLYVIRSGRSSIFALAGRLPAWFANPAEYAAVSALARAP